MIKIEVDNLNVKIECDPSVGLNNLRCEAVTAIHSIAGTISTVTKENHKEALTNLTIAAMATSEAFVDSLNKTVCVLPEVKRRADD